MNILGYVKKYGNLSFKEKPFNNVDALILVTLSYLNFNFFIKEGGSMLIKDIKEDSIEELCAGEFITKSNEKMIRLLKNARRYKNIEVKHVYSVHDKLNTIQFFGITLIVPDYHPFICFRGTDLTLVGWKEDLMLATHNVLPSQVEALNYTNYVSKKINGPFSIAGHSKGGNLAMFSAIYSKGHIQDRLDKIYAFDAPGFKDNKIFTSEKYNRVKDKIVQFVPKDDVVGCLFYTPRNKFIVKSKSVHFLQHNPYFWLLNNKGNNFKFLAKESLLVKSRRRTMILWINQLGLEECEFMIDKLISSLGGIDSSLSYRFDLAVIKFRAFLANHFTHSKAIRKRLYGSVSLFLKIWRESRRYYSKNPNAD